LFTENVPVNVLLEVIVWLPELSVGLLPRFWASPSEPSPSANATVTSRARANTEDGELKASILQLHRKREIEAR